jgi:hypothetical protein
MNNDLSFSFYASGSFQMSGNLVKVIRHMRYHHYFNKATLKEALAEMQKNGHVRAHFGMGKCFMFSLDDRIEDGQKAS